MSVLSQTFVQPELRCGFLLCHGWLAEIALSRLRTAHCVLGLADKHDPDWVEAACAKAIAAGDPSYCTIKDILAAGTEHIPPPPTIDNNALLAALRALTLSGRRWITSTPASPRPAPATSAIWSSAKSCATTRSPAARPPRSPGASGGARFGQTLTLEGFDFAAPRKRPAAQIRDLAGLRWLQAGESVIFYGLGPPNSPCATSPQPRPATTTS